MYDETESTRRAMLANGVPQREAALAQPVMSTDEMSQHYTVLSFMAPFVIVRRKRDGKCGTLMFNHSPRQYFGWQADDQTEG